MKCNRLVNAAMVTCFFVLSNGKAAPANQPDAGKQSSSTNRPLGVNATATDAAIEKGPATGPIRFATFNVAMNRKSAGGLVAELKEGELLAGQQVAEIVQRVRPHVLLLNEVDFDEDHQSIQILRDRYFAVSQSGQTPIRYPYFYTDSVNTGEPSGMDLDLDGRIEGPGDGFGFGQFPGQYGMVVLSQFPIDREAVRSMQTFLWKDMPDAAWPVDPTTRKPVYSADVMERFRLSSKSHWDVPISVRGKVIHFLVCHPTPPVFDGPEDRNGKRNHDEVRLWADYVDPERGQYIYDDNGRQGGLSAGAYFVIAGDLNSDPVDGDSDRSTMSQLLDHPLVHPDLRPKSSGGGRIKATRDGGANARQVGDPDQDTGDFSDRASGNLRIDYVLPSKTLKAIGSGVFWPGSEEEGADLVGASDHRLVWVDVDLCE